MPVCVVRLFAHQQVHDCRLHETTGAVLAVFGLHCGDGGPWPLLDATESGPGQLQIQWADAAL